MFFSTAMECMNIYALAILYFFKQAPCCGDQWSPVQTVWQHNEKAKRGGKGYGACRLVSL
jgi:hypothetical protein